MNQDDQEAGVRVLLAAKDAIPGPCRSRKVGQNQNSFLKPSVTNISKEPRKFFGDGQKLFADGAVHSADTEAAIYLGDESQSLWEEINPGNTVKGIVVFDVKKGAKLERVELHDSSLSGGVEVRL